jgi:hypothetical protein
MLPDPITMAVDDNAVTVDYNTINQAGRSTVRKGLLAGTLTGISTHAPILNCNVAHTSTKAGRERSLLRLDISTTHASTGVKESASLSLVLDHVPTGALNPHMVRTLLAQVLNTLCEGYGITTQDGQVTITPSSIIGQFINGEA